MSLRHAVLGMVAEVPGCSGYDLLKVFEMAMGNVWSATQSQVYGELGRLDTDGLIEVTTEGPRGRKEYAITAAGRRELRRWLTETEPKSVKRDEALLRVFFLGQIEPDQARAYLRDQAKSAEQRRERFEALATSTGGADDDGAFYGGLTLEYAQRFMAMRRDWAEWARDRIGERLRDSDANDAHGTDGLRR